MYIRSPGSVCTILKITILAFVIHLSSCHHKQPTWEHKINIASNQDTIATISDLQRGDLLVKPNNNWLYGSSSAMGGIFFGHIAIVLNDVQNSNTEDLLKNTLTFESVASKLPETHQNRTIYAYVDSSDSLKSNYSFSVKGSRYRLRPRLSSESIDSVISYILSKDEGIHSWRAIKSFEKTTKDERVHWYCSLLIWQAYYDIAGIDLDCNEGFIVYPNDMINHPMFDGEINGIKARVRF